MIQIENLTHRYPRRPKPALEAVSFRVESGAVFGLLGPNGAGKTTLMRILSTLILPTEGMACLCGYQTGHDEAQIRKVIGLASGSERAFYYRLTAFQNLEFFGGMLGLYGKALSMRVEQVLDDVGLREAQNVLYMRFSAGMKRRLSLARALLTDPPIYLLDEPTSGVDPASTQKIQELIQFLQKRGKAILLATHNMEEANLLSDTIGILRDGRLIAIDTPSNLRQSLKKRQMIVTFEHQAVEQTQAIAELIQQLEHNQLVHSFSLGNPHLQIQLCDAATDVGPLLQDLLACHLPIHAISTKDATLQDVFFRFTEAGVPVS